MTFWSQLGNWGPVFNLKILGLGDAQSQDVVTKNSAGIPEFRGVGTAGALANAMLKPRGGGRVSFRPRNIFPHFCMLFLKLPLFVIMLPTYN